MWAVALRLFRGGQAPDVPGNTIPDQHLYQIGLLLERNQSWCANRAGPWLQKRFKLAVRIKAIRGDGTIFLNDGIYGGLADLRDMGAMAALT